ncbi:hypothetical protein T10_8934 [Trichinella papuae]|uniref:C2H2-type domain-containing protein n=1 Tax=Trichinella papuae TaxID=268474 RepID=A0A0V1MBJ1_9BILA|nr:hypothetical protein T10_8934 [Trichinella papuae]
MSQIASYPKKLVIGKERLVRLLRELNQLLEERAVVPEIEEQLRMTEELHRQIDVLQEEFEAGLDEEERNIAMDEWSKYRRSFREGKAKARALITERQAVDLVPGSTRSEERKVYIRFELPNHHPRTRRPVQHDGQPSSHGEKRVIVYPGPFKCHLCSFTSSTWLSTELHFKIVHNFCQFMFVCSKCSKEWPSINSVTNHYACYKGGVAPVNIPSTSTSTYACSSCGAFFDTKNGLQLHCKRAHPDAFLETCSQKTKARWSSDLINYLAKLEASIHPADKNINQVLQQKLTEFRIVRNVEMIKGQRGKATYKELELQYRRDQQAEETVGSPHGAVGSSQVNTTSAHYGDSVSCDLIREACRMTDVDINELQVQLLCNLASTRTHKSRGVREHDSRSSIKANVRVARFKRFQRLFQNNRRKLLN